MIAAPRPITFSESSLTKFDQYVTVLDVSLEGIPMHHRLLAAAATAILLITPVSVSAQYGDGYGGGRRGGGYCDQLRRACENKDSLGEVGQGNCRRFREECGRPRPPRRDVCRELRQACLYKDQLGEGGRGNCREYRETCR